MYFSNNQRKRHHHVKLTRHWPLTELERLRKEVQELKTENALLKKVRALVEERNARLREIGHGPSKN